MTAGVPQDFGQSREPADVASKHWTLEENKAFEVALARHFADADRWDKISCLVPNKSPLDVQIRYRQLEDDILRIERGCASLPQSTSTSQSDDAAPLKKQKQETAANGDRRKGVPWTEEEHRLFLLGLAKFGKGDWRSIARNFVVSRTPTQVASHAQKYFIRLNSMNKKDKRRASIHDITSVGNIHHAIGDKVTPAVSLPPPVPPAPIMPHAGLLSMQGSLPFPGMALPMPLPLPAPYMTALQV